MILYLAIHFNDVCDYISIKDILLFFTGSALLFRMGERDLVEPFTLAALLFPASFVYEAVIGMHGSDESLSTIPQSLAESLLYQDQPDVYAVLLVIAAAGANTCIVSSEDLAVQARRRQSVRTDQQRLHKILERVLDGRTLIRDLVAGDLSTIFAGPSDRKPESIARALSILFFRGDHRCYFSNQIATLDDQAAPLIRDGLIDALALMRKLPSGIVTDMAEQLDALSAQLVTIDCSFAASVERLREIASDVLDRIWDYHVRPHFISPKILLDGLRSIAAEIPFEYYNTGLTGGHFIFFSCREKQLMWNLFTPDASHRNTHFDNVLRNAVRHFPQVRLQLKATDPPLVVGYLLLDEECQRLHVVISDRGEVPRDPNAFFSSAHALSYFREFLPTYGGSLIYIEMSGGLGGDEPFEYGPTPDQLSQMLEEGIDLTAYRKAFVTSFCLTVN